MERCGVISIVLCVLNVIPLCKTYYFRSPVQPKSNGNQPCNKVIVNSNVNISCESHRSHMTTVEGYLDRGIEGKGPYNFVYFTDGKSILGEERTHNTSISHLRNNKFIIAIYNLQKAYSGKYFCRMVYGNGDNHQTQRVCITVVDAETTSTSSTTTTPSTTTTSSTTTTESSASVGTTRTSSPDTRTVTSTSSEPTLSNLMYRVAGILGSTLLLIIITLVVFKLTRPRNDKIDSNPQGNRELFDGDTEYAKISDTSNTRKESENVLQTPLYEGCEKREDSIVAIEDHYAPVDIQEPSTSDNTKNKNNNVVGPSEGDVYSVVQKKDQPPKTEPSEPDDVYSVVQKKAQPNKTEPSEPADVYSVVQRSAKEDQNVHSEPSDVYSVVQKNTKTSQSESNDVYSVVQKDVSEIRQ